jgi:hypothetical protein
MDAKQFIQHDTVPFLATLFQLTAEEAKSKDLTWQVFPESPDALASDFLHPQIFYGSLYKHWKRFVALNEAGFGIFLCSALTNSAKRTQMDVRQFYYVMVDIDDKDRDQTIHPEPPTPIADFGLDQAPSTPTVIVQSGHGWHLYYVLTAPASRADWPSLLKIRLGLYERFRSWGADRKVAVDMARVMRLPGTMNMKSAPAPVQVMMYCGSTYTIDDLLAAFPYSEPVQIPSEDEPMEVLFDYTPSLPLDERISLAMDALDDHPAAIETQDGSSTTLRAAQIGFAHALTPEETFALLLSEYNERCEPPWEPKDLKRKVREAYRYAKKHNLIGSALSDFKQQRIAQIRKQMDQYGIEDGN